MRIPYVSTSSLKSSLGWGRRLRSKWKQGISVSILTLYLPTLLTTSLNSYLLYKMWRSRRHLEGVIDISQSQQETEKLVVIVIIANLTATIIAWFPEQYIFLSMDNQEALQTKVGTMLQ